MSDATIWSITLALSLKILEASFSLIYDVYSTAGNTKGGSITIDLLFDWFGIGCMTADNFFCKTD